MSRLIRLVYLSNALQCVAELINFVILASMLDRNSSVMDVAEGESALLP